MAGSTSPLTSGRGLPGHLVEFVAALRRHHIGVGPGETVDAARVFTAVGGVGVEILRREVLREGLAAVLLRRSGQRGTFDVLFDLYFPPALGATGDLLAQDADGGVDLEATRDRLAELLTSGDLAGQRSLAAAVTEAMGAVEGSGTGPTYSAYRALDRLSPQTLLTRVLESLGAGTGLADEVTRRDVRERIAGFRRMVEAEARRRTAEQRGRDRVARSAVPRQPEQVEFLSAGGDELADLRRRVTPLARRLAARLAVRRRRARRGQLDLRRTLRRSMSTGGVPVHPVHRRPRPGRPELVLLCDVSGSVAGFSQFTLLLVQALAEQFSRVRVFAFVDHTDEVTDLVDSDDPHPAALLRRVFSEAEVSRGGHSDYGAALATFAKDWPDAVGPRTSLLILGDGRTNYADPRLSVLVELADAARQVHWLNPEPRAHWGNGDSDALRYGRVVPMHECRTPTQLTEVVEGLLPV